MSRLTATLALAALLTGSFTQAAEPEYVTIAMEIDVAKPAAEAWAKVGGYCDISKWANLACEITSGDGGIGTVRVLDKGRVTEILAEVGDTVQRGQPLAEIASPELTTAQLNYLRSYSASTQAERAVDRARQLLQADVIERWAM